MNAGNVEQLSRIREPGAPLLPMSLAVERVHAAAEAKRTLWFDLPRAVQGLQMRMRINWVEWRTSSAH
jgi:hypothetical protein